MQFIYFPKSAVLAWLLYFDCCRQFLILLNVTFQFPVVSISHWTFSSFRPWEKTAWSIWLLGTPNVTCQLRFICPEAPGNILKPTYHREIHGLPYLYSSSTQRTNDSHVNQTNFLHPMTIYFCALFICIVSYYVSLESGVYCNIHIILVLCSLSITFVYYKVIYM